MKPVVFIDSGVGGLPYLWELRSRAPGQSLVYVADQQNFPYGTKSVEELQGLLHELLLEICRVWDPQIVVLACNTASVVGLEYLRAEFPEITFIGTVPAVKPAALNSVNRAIGVLSTTRTSQDPYLLDLIRRYAADCLVHITPLDPLVALVESGQHRNPAVLREILQPVIEEYQEAGIDRVVLGCTHFIHADAELARLFGPGISLVDSRKGVINRVMSFLRKISPAIEDDEAPETGHAPWLYHRGRGNPGAVYQQLLTDAKLRRWCKETVYE